VTSYPLAPPTTPQVSDVHLTMADRSGATTSPITLATQVQRRSLGRWEMNMTVGVESYAQSRAWTTFLQALRGPYGTFLFGDPDWTGPLGNLGAGELGTVVVNGGGQTGHTLAVAGLTTSTAAVLKAGDLLQLGDQASAQLYVATQDADSDASGQATLDIWPRLRGSPRDGDNIVLALPKGLWRLRPGYQVGWDSDSAKTVQPISIDAVEAL